MRLALAAMTLALVTMLPAAAADPVPDVCPYGDCITVTASAGPGGVDVTVTERVDWSGASVHVHAGPDGIDVDSGVGITRCHSHVGLDEIILNQCVF